MATDETTWLKARIEKTETLIEAYEDAILALANGAQMYSLDTGQTRQMVQRSQLGSLRVVLESLENRRVTLLARLNGGGMHVTPGW